jgi:hypothetical protein
MVTKAAFQMPPFRHAGRPRGLTVHQQQRQLARPVSLYSRDEGVISLFASAARNGSWTMVQTRSGKKLAESLAAYGPVEIGVPGGTLDV